MKEYSELVKSLRHMAGVVGACPTVELGYVASLLRQAADAIEDQHDNRVMLTINLDGKELGRSVSERIADIMRYQGL